MGNPFTVRRSAAGEHDSIVVLSVEGYLDAYTAPVFERSIQTEIESGRIRLIVDCAKLTYISSAGLGVFMGFIEEVREKGGDIKICGLIPKVRQVFELLGFPALYDMHADVPEAVTRFATGPARELDVRSLERTFRLQVPSSPENLSMIRDFVTSVGEQAGLSEDEVAKLELAVDEACANVIEHAYGNDVAQELTVRATFDDDTLRIGIVDTGRGFDPASVPNDDLSKLISERRTGGLGLRIIKTLMDQVHYEIEPGKKNELQMVKRLRKG